MSVFRRAYYSTNKSTMMRNDSRLKLCALLLALGSVGGFCSVTRHPNVLPPLSSRAITQISSTRSKQPEETKIEAESNFWFNKISTEQVDEDRIPHYPNGIDRDGRLPPPCYRALGDATYEPVPTCMVSVAVDLLMDNRVDSLEPTLIVKKMHRLIDSGFTSFHLKGLPEWGQEQIYGRLRRETPLSVFRSCHLVVPIKCPEKSLGDVRDEVMAILARTGTDAIDTIQLKYNPKSPYHLDFLDSLAELQREGLIRSIAGRHIPPSLLRKAHDCGFRFDSNQIKMNLMDPVSFYTSELLSACKDTNTPIIAEGVLAGGLLTNRHLGQLGQPRPWELTPQERNAFQGSSKDWVTQHKSAETSIWKTYQDHVMSVLGYISRKHRVTVAAVALRWALQQELVTSVVPSCTLYETDDRPFDRPAQLRQVFSFELDGEDLEKLWAISGKEKPSSYMMNLLHDIENFEEVSEGLFLRRSAADAGPSNSRVWFF